MHNITNPLQTLLFDPFDGILTEKHVNSYSTAGPVCSPYYPGDYAVQYHCRPLCPPPN